MTSTVDAHLASLRRGVARGDVSASQLRQAEAVAERERLSRMVVEGNRDRLSRMVVDGNRAGREWIAATAALLDPWRPVPRRPTRGRT
jgi:hypothetical protein